ncbi:MAG: hypothetical protein JHC84_06730 [Solirubrobacteraceae bacterium]|nr:hypothetical protein [Solirubrobacteraceae bacterium]
MSSRPITDELVAQVIDDLQARYGMDQDDLRELGARLAGTDRQARQDENVAFAERFIDEHARTFDRLSR